MRPLKEIEYSFFGCIFDNPPARILEALDVGAKPEWFTDDKCRLMWTAIENIRKNQTLENLKPLTIVQEAVRLTRKKKDEFSGIEITPAFYDEAIHFRSKADNGEKSDIVSYAEILRSGSIDRRIRGAMAETNDELSSASNSSAVGSQLANKLIGIISDETTSKDVNVTELLNGMFASYDRAYEEFAIKKNYDYVNGIPMPWEKISHIMNGLQPGLHIVAARPSVGKTSFVLQCIDFWCANGYKVVFNCLDMAVSQIIKRPAANLARVAIDRAERGLVTPIEQKRLKDAGATISDWYETGRFNLLSEYDVNSFKTWCTIRHSAGKLDIAVVDYAQQLRIRGGGNKSENDRLTQVSAILKSIAVELGIPVIALSQLSRDNVKDKNGSREPTIADLRGSGSLEQDAFSITLLHKDEGTMASWHNEAPPDQLVPRTGDDSIDEKVKDAMGAVWWIHAKNQNGSTGRYPFVVYQNHYRWYLGDNKADVGSGSNRFMPKFSKIMADWRFFEDPIKSLEEYGSVVYPNYWPQKCARMCASMGIELPDSILKDLREQDIQNHRQALIEFNRKKEEDRILAQQPINPPQHMVSESPTVKAMAAQPSTMNVPPSATHVGKEYDNPSVDGYGGPVTTEATSSDNIVDEEPYPELETDADIIF